MSHRKKSTSDLYYLILFCTTLYIFAFIFIESFAPFACLIGAACALALFAAGLRRIRRKLPFARSRLALGATLLLKQFYLFAGTDAWTPAGPFAGALPALALALMPIPYLMFMTGQLPHRKPIYRNLTGVMWFNAALQLALVGAGFLPAQVGGLISGVLLCFATLLITWHSFENARGESLTFVRRGLLLFLAISLPVLALGWLLPSAWRLPFSATSALCFGGDLLLLFSYVALLQTDIEAMGAFIPEYRQSFLNAIARLNSRASLEMQIERLNENTELPISILFIVLHNLKQVNNSRGHYAGDALILALLDCIYEAFDGIGSVSRYSGDEVVVLVEGENPEKVSAARARLERLLEEKSKKSVPLEVSIGMASRSAAVNRALTATEILKLADKDRNPLYPSAETADSRAIEHLPLKHFDPLTGLLTFPSFVAHARDRLLHFDAPACIISFDVNYFNCYNMLFGRQLGDQLLLMLAKIARELRGENGLCGRGEDDNFWVLTDYSHPQKLLDKITAETSDFQAKQGDCLLFPSFGIYRVEDRSLPISEMCSRAGAAKRSIKGHFDTLYCLYTEEERLRRINDMELISYMQNALDTEEFKPFYQPKFSTDERRLVGAEALSRWARPNGQHPSPAEFTDLFEKSGLIRALDWFIFEKVCAFQRSRLDKGLACVPISTNFSRIHVYEEDCVERACRIADSYRVPHGLLEVEMTETAFIQDVTRIRGFIDALHSKGFVVCMDDFGSGLSSLGELKRLPVDVVKLDRVFLTDNCETSFGRIILECVCYMCAILNIQTVAEAVETTSQYNFLRSCGCDVIQGNYFSRALPEDAFTALLDRGSISSLPAQHEHTAPVNRDGYRLRNVDSLLAILSSDYGETAIGNLTDDSCLILRAKKRNFEDFSAANGFAGLLQRMTEQLAPESREAFRSFCAGESLHQAAQSGKLLHRISVHRAEPDGKRRAVEVNLVFFKSGNSDQDFCLLFTRP